MNTLNQLSRPVKYALLSALAAGILGTLLINSIIEMLSWIFVPSVIIMVFFSAFFTFRRQMRGVGKLTARRIFLLSIEVGTLSHFYAFALYLPLNFFFVTQTGSLNPELLLAYLLATLVMGFVSILMFVWFAVPMYLGIGYLVKAAEESMTFDEYSMDAPSLDNGITVDRVYRNDDLDF